MLTDFRELAEKLALKFNDIDYWPEIEFNHQDIQFLKTIEGVKFVNRHSIQIQIDKNHAILPSQYILYSISIKPLAVFVKEYLDVFETAKNGNSQNFIGEAILNSSLDYSNLDIDEYSKTIGPKIFTDKSFNLEAKSIVNGTRGNYNIRGITDFYGSIILKPINIPNASSTILGKFIYKLASNKDIYDYLEKRFLRNTPYILKDKHIKTFTKNVFLFLYQYDKLERLKNYIARNEDPSYSSIKFEDKSLTSIFKTSTSPLDKKDLKFNDDRIRYFEEPLFMLNNEYYYFSTEWTNRTNSRLDLNSLTFLLSRLYPEFNINFENEFYIFKYFEDNLSKSSSNQKKIIQQIFYGAPGTGKSHKIEKIIEDVPQDQKERVTFHPEYDYSSFVGGYRPYSEKKGDEYVITYRFIPQIFTNIYIKAWQNPGKDYYLVIEEINRGNCAEIFGDLFQLLDRNSNYNISPSKDLLDYLKQQLTGDAVKGIEGDKMRLPSNLHLLASMNTSDQSLFPMDSAFKRRWSWEYVPVNYEESANGVANPSYNFQVELGPDKRFKWIDFIKKVNQIIKLNPNLGLDKCLGNYFIKPSENIITLEEFVNKAMFYLWIDVFKDEEDSIFKSGNEIVTYEDFFPVSTLGIERVKNLLDDLEVSIIDAEEEQA
ncbi:AAA family ATPase [Flavobacterium sp. DG1-102-2]|uniref:McrB family protein n=1 Tax=Flavobacterium sp. DG1-102-2 TaxID=3081663 RepID=UPI002949B4B4|nr:AAA family ATPase [Flavobacterium sp. DG1-102-2]MDV6167615.1 AAA family ATPase [Flavobacterium sp. DG1-102-2]